MAILQQIRVGEGLVGQCALEKRRMLITDLPPHTTPIRSGLFEAIPRNVIVLPVLFEDRVKAVIELASLNAFTTSHLAFLEQLTASIGIVLNSIEATMQTEGLLKQSQQLAVELQTQQKELQQTNEQLAQKAQQLAEQNAEVERKNQEIEQARGALEEKAKELALTSKYKSEFLANMSHELRTPLNSILVLGQQLAENPDSNLSGKQVEFARTIHGAGTDLLNLISDILDLSKIESGTVSVEAEEVFFGSLIEMVARPFRHEADNRKLTFEIETDAHLARSLVTDSKRLQQVLKNLLSNAFKFTEQGGVRLSVSPVTSGWTPTPPDPRRGGVGHRVRGLRYRHRHSGREAEDHLRGLPAGGCGHQPQVRRHRSGARHQPRTGQPAGRRDPAAEHAGQGQHVHALSAADLRRARYRSAVTALSDARTSRIADASHSRRSAAAEIAIEAIEDDRNNLQPGDAILLIVEDDVHYARILCDLSRDKGFKVLVALRGAEALALAREFHPTAISLDVSLPDMLGWTVLNHLKQDPATRHIPVQMLTLDEDWHHGLSHGAFAFVTKPTTHRRPGRRDRAHPRILAPAAQAPAGRGGRAGAAAQHRGAAGHDDIEVDVVSTGEDALAAVEKQTFDCLVLDLRLPDMTGFELLEQLNELPTSARSCRSSSLPERICPRRKTPACICSRAASSSRMSSPPSACWMKRRSSCIALSPICPRTSRTCWTGCIAPTKR